MIYSIQGTVAEKGEDFVVVQSGDIAYYLNTTLITIAEISETVGKITFYTYLNVREDAMELYGFASKEEKEWFQMLITVSGVGPKAGLAILSTLTPDNLSLSILNEDVKSLSTCKGIGPKTAKRIVLELKDKVAKMDISSVSLSGNSGSAYQQAGNLNSNFGEATSALMALGYSQLEASQAIRGADRDTDTETLIKLGLKALAKGV